MELNVGKEVAALRKMTMKQLRERYAEVFGDATNANNKAWLLKRIAWRLQANSEGDLTERAKRRAAELANDADLRLSPPKALPEPRDHTIAFDNNDGRLPPPGSVITREYKGQAHQVRVLPAGFEFEGEAYKSLSAVAKAITGQHCNGYLFFKLAKGVTS
jgi:hypothetical protein